MTSDDIRVVGETAGWPCNRYSILGTRTLKWRIYLQDLWMLELSHDRDVRHRCRDRFSDRALSWKSFRIMSDNESG